MDLIMNINPTIVTSGNWLKNRQYHAIIRDANNVAPEMPLYAPADSVAIGITHYVATMQPWSSPPYDTSQFDIRFQASCDVAFWFDHISSLAEPFASLAAKVGSRDTKDASVPINVEVKAGDLIGWTTGTDPARVFDFIVTDSRKPVIFANQERYEKTGNLQHLLHTACPYDYYDADMRAAFMAKFGWWNGSAQGPTACGASVDVVGAQSGGWFQTAFNPNDLFPSADWGFVSKIEADGSVYLAGPGWGVRTDSDAPTFADPTTMTTEHCYQHYSNPTSWAYLRIVSDMEIAVAHGDGTCPASMPTDIIVYYR
jgi:hypothetical protein